MSQYGLPQLRAECVDGLCSCRTGCSTMWRTLHVHILAGCEVRSAQLGAHRQQRVRRDPELCHLALDIHAGSAEVVPLSAAVRGCVTDQPRRLARTEQIAADARGPDLVLPLRAGAQLQCGEALFLWALDLGDLHMVTC